MPSQERHSNDSAARLTMNNGVSLIEFATSEREGALDMRFFRLRCSDLSQSMKNNFHLHNDNEICSGKCTKSTKILIKINRICPDCWVWCYKVCKSRGKNAAASESLARVRFLGYGQGEINFRAWQRSMELHCIIYPRQKEKREKCRTRASPINIITSDSDGARYKLIQESIVENVPVNWKVPISEN